MAIELEQFCKDLEEKGHAKAAESLRKHSQKLQEKGLLPRTIATRIGSTISREEYLESKRKDVLEFSNMLRREFGATVDDNVPLSKLGRERKGLGKNLTPLIDIEDKFPKWTELLEKVDPNDRQLITSALNRAKQANFELVGQIRSIQLEDLRRIRGMGEFGALFLSTVFTPIQKEK